VRATVSRVVARGAVVFENKCCAVCAKVCFERRLIFVQKEVKLFRRISSWSRDDEQATRGDADVPVVRHNRSRATRQSDGASRASIALVSSTPYTRSIPDTRSIEPRLDSPRSAFWFLRDRDLKQRRI